MENTNLPTEPPGDDPNNPSNNNPSTPSENRPDGTQKGTPDSTPASTPDSTPASTPDSTPDTTPATTLGVVPTMFEQLGVLIDAVVVTEKAKRAAEAAQVVALEEARRQMEAIQQASPAELAKTGSVRFVSYDEAWQSFAAEVGLALHIPDRTANRLIDNAYTLSTSLPATLTALAEGEISYRHGVKMIDHTLNLTEEQMLLFEQAALPKAVELTVTKFDTAARKLRQSIDPISIEERHRTAAENRAITLEPNRDAMATLNLYISALDGVAIQDRIYTIAQNLKALPGEERTLAQIRADVAVMLLQEGDLYPRTTTTIETIETETNTSSTEKETTTDTKTDTENTEAETTPATSTPEAPSPTHTRGIGPYAGIVPTVMVTVPVLAMLDAVTGRKIGDHGDATLEGYGPIPMEQALELAGTAKSFIRLLTDPETGTVLSVGRTRYRPPADLARWTDYRDGTCTKPNCNCSAKHSDIDHTVAWSRNGETRYDNLANECPSDHRMKHAKVTDGTTASDGELMTCGTAWTVEHERDAQGRSTGTLIWTTPTGRRYLSRPSVKIAPPPATITEPRPEEPEDNTPF